MHGHIQRAFVAVVVLLCTLPSAIQGQTEASQDSVAEAARKTQAQKSAEGHVSAKQTLDDDNSPKANMVRSVHEFWATIPPSKLIVLVPTSSRPAEHGLEIALDKSSVYVPFGETTWTPDLNEAAQQYFDMLLTRSRFNGAPLKLGRREETTVGDQPAILVHFSFPSRAVGYDGMAMFISVPEQILSFGCIYRTIDWEKAQPICEEIVNSAEVSFPTDYKSFKKPF
jgi:hypothetical protein